MGSLIRLDLKSKTSIIKFENGLLWMLFVKVVVSINSEYCIPRGNRKIRTLSDVIWILGGRFPEKRLLIAELFTFCHAVLPDCSHFAMPFCLTQT